jgi:hypothetical protein
MTSHRMAAIRTASSFLRAALIDLLPSPLAIQSTPSDSLLVIFLRLYEPDVAFALVPDGD